MIKKNLCYIVMNDIHLGHRTVRVNNIVYSLDRIFIDNKKLMNKVNIIFIAGDIFDRLLQTNSDDYNIAMEWLNRLVKYCSNRNIKLRILEGTPSHDWKQARVLISTIKELDIKIDFKYIDTVHIEIMKDNELSILYVPDEWSTDPEDTLKEVKGLLQDNNLDKVDIAIMHGQFPYQIPQIELHSSHNAEEYLSLVDRYIHIGHIHKFSVMDRIIAGGSVDRLSHGEEEKKGIVAVFLTASGNNNFVFVENKNAAVFKTVKITTTNVLDVIDTVKDIVKTREDLVHIRLDVDKNNPVITALQTIKEKVPNAKIILKPFKKEDNNDGVVIDVSSDDYIKIDSTNLPELLGKEMEKHNLTKEELVIYNDELKEVM